MSTADFSRPILLRLDRDTYSATVYGPADSPVVRWIDAAGINEWAFRVDNFPVALAYLAALEACADRDPTLILDTDDFAASATAWLSSISEG